MRIKEQEQMMIPGSDTPLSIAAEECLDSSGNLLEAKAVLDKKRSELAMLMQKHNITTLKHCGRIFILQKGRKRKDTVAVL